MRPGKGSADLITREKPAFTKSNPYDIDPKDAEATEASSSVAIDKADGVIASPRLHTHRNQQGRFSKVEDCVVCNVSLAQPPSWLVVPSGFSVLRTDQGGWTITPSPLPLPLLPSVAEDGIVRGSSRVSQEGHAEQKKRHYS